MNLLKKFVVVLWSIVFVSGCADPIQSNQLQTHDITPQFFFDSENLQGIVSAVFKDSSGRPVVLSEGDRVMIYHNTVSYRMMGNAYLGYIGPVMFGMTPGTEVRVALERDNFTDAPDSTVIAITGYATSGPQGSYARDANIGMSWVVRPGREFELLQKWYCRANANADYVFVIDDVATTDDDGEHTFDVASVLNSLSENTDGGCRVEIKTIALTPGEIDSHYNEGSINVYQAQEYVFFIDAL